MTSPADRLTNPEPGVRRIAIMDLVRLGTPDADAALLHHLPAERDPKSARLIIDHLACRHPGAAAALLALYADPATPAPIAVHAIRVHDAVLDPGD